jgi:hypothetical protein
LATKEYGEGGRNPFAAWKMPGTEEKVSKGSLGVCQEVFLVFFP